MIKLNKPGQTYKFIRLVINEAYGWWDASVRLTRLGAFGNNLPADGVLESAILSTLYVVTDD